jgi:hypothetical protein
MFAKNPGKPGVGQKNNRGLGRGGGANCADTITVNRFVLAIKPSRQKQGNWMTVTLNLCKMKLGNESDTVYFGLSTVVRKGI